MFIERVLLSFKKMEKLLKKLRENHIKVKVENENLKLIFPENEYDENILKEVKQK